MTSQLPDLFETKLWPARWHCGQWSDLHGWTYIISDALIWLAYFAIPVIILAYIYRKQYELRYTKTYVLFATFILLCGSTHLIDAMMFWVPAYYFNTFVRALTGIVSMFTVWHLFRILPAAFREKTSITLEREIQKRLEAERQLALANEGLKSFAYMASHDLQEPLRKVSLYTSQLRDTLATADDGTKAMVEKTVRASDRMRQIIQGILSLSSIREDTPFERVELRDVLQTAAADLEMRIRERNAKIEIGDLPGVLGNRSYLVQLFSNLLSNAIKFTTETPEIAVNGSRESSSVQVSVRDNGIGMRKQDLEKIFNAFERLHAKSDYEGSGIGLAICKKIVEIHRGSIAVESEVGKGTVFTVSLPAAERE